MGLAGIHGVFALPSLAHSWVIPMQTPSHSTKLNLLTDSKASKALRALILVSSFTFLVGSSFSVRPSAAILTNVGIETPSSGRTSFASKANSLVFFTLKTALAKSMCMGLNIFIGSIIARLLNISIHLDCKIIQTSYIITPTGKNSGHKKGAEALVKPQRPHDQPTFKGKSTMNSIKYSRFSVCFKHFKKDFLSASVIRSFSAQVLGGAA